MDKKKITYFQLFALTFFVNCHSTMLFPIGENTYQDTWISIIISLLITFVVILLFNSLINKYPNSDIITIIQNLIGKKFGAVILILYSAYFIYIGSRNIMDYFFLTSQTLLPTTPRWFMLLITLLPIMYCINIGFEALGKSAKILFIVITSVIAFTFLMLYIQNNDYQVLHWEYLTPILESGWSPIVAYSSKSFSFMFGEIIVFFFLFSYLKDSKKGIKTIYTSMIYNAFFMILIIVAATITIGPTLYSISTFSVATFAQTMELEFLDRVDVFFIAMDVIFTFLKASLFYFTSVFIITRIYKKFSFFHVSIFYAIVLFVIIITIPDDSFAFFDFGLNTMTIYINPVMQIVIPILLVILSIFRKKKQRNEFIENQKS